MSVDNNRQSWYDMGYYIIYMSRESLPGQVEAVRLPKSERKEVSVKEEETALIFAVAKQGRENLAKHFVPGLGLVPSEGPEENFYQLWTRDAAQYIGNLPEDAKAALTSLAKLFEHQREDGALPLRVEKEYMMIKLAPGLRKLAKPAFNLIEGKIRGRTERPVYEGQDFSGAEDTVPVAIIAAGELFKHGGNAGKKFFEDNYKKIFKAVDFFYKKTDEADGLAQTGELSPDWEDSINRPGKLGGINVYWYRALHLMGEMCAATGRTEEAGLYKKMAAKVNKNIREKLYDKDTGCIKSATDDDRIDTAASIFAGLYLLTPSEAEKMQQTFKDKLTSPSGFLLNHDRPYSLDEKQMMHYFIGHMGYHDKYVWPWVTCQNIQVKIKIARHHPDESIKEKYKKEAVEDLVMAAENFKNNKGAYEILNPETGKPAISHTYKPPKDFMANWAAYLSAYEQAVKLGWIKNK